LKWGSDKVLEGGGDLERWMILRGVWHGEIGRFVLESLKLVIFAGFNDLYCVYRLLIIFE
jgi:hypothetical protein